MTLITFEDYNGNKVQVNSEMVQTISSYQHFDHDMKLPDDLMIINGDGHPEVSNDPKKLAKANDLRTSERVIVLHMNGTSHVVKGTLAEVQKALGKGTK